MADCDKIVTMTLNQLETLTDEEMAIVLYIVNVVAPPESPKMEFEPRHLTWFKHDMLVKKIVDAFPKVKPEGHDTYKSLLAKLGMVIEIRKNIVPPLVLPDSASLAQQPTTSSVQPPTEITSSI
jgi:hypothetical protein